MCCRTGLTVMASVALLSYLITSLLSACDRHASAALFRNSLCAVLIPMFLRIVLLFIFLRSASAASSWLLGFNGEGMSGTYAAPVFEADIS
jgi:hypothetical protein